MLEGSAVSGKKILAEKQALYDDGLWFESFDMIRFLLLIKCWKYQRHFECLLLSSTFAPSVAWSRSMIGVTMKNKIKNCTKTRVARAGTRSRWPPPTPAPPTPGCALSRLFPGHAEHYDHSNLKTNLRPEHKKSDVEYAPMTFPYWSPDADMAHEVRFWISMIMSRKITISRQNLFRYNILERKGPSVSGWSLGFCPYYFFGMNLSINTTPMKTITESNVLPLSITPIKKIPTTRIPTRCPFKLGLSQLRRKTAERHWARGRPLVRYQRWQESLQ